MWAIVVWVVVVYLGEHYVADVLGGIAYATIAVLIVRALDTRSGRQNHSAMAGAPTATTSE